MIDAWNLPPGVTGSEPAISGEWPCPECLHTMAELCPHCDEQCCARCGCECLCPDCGTPKENTTARFCPACTTYREEDDG